MQETPTANLRSLVLDLASLQSVRTAATEVLKYSEPIDVLFNNAAIMASPYHITKDGFEAQFGTNHLGPFLFTNLFLLRILASKTGSPRIINVTSVAHRASPVNFDDISFHNGKTYDKWLAYGQSKTASILFALELSNRYKDKDLCAFSIHPGGIATNLGRDLTADDDHQQIVDYESNLLFPETIRFKNISQGTATHIFAGFDPSIKSQSGLHLQDCHIDTGGAKPYALDNSNAERLWTLSEQLVGQKF